MVTGTHQALVRCSVLRPSKEYRLAFKYQEHRGHWLRLQTTAWLVPWALSSACCLQHPLVQSVSALDQVPSFSWWFCWPLTRICACYGDAENAVIIIWLALMQHQWGWTLKVNHGWEQMVVSKEPSKLKTPSMPSAKKDCPFNWHTVISCVCICSLLQYEVKGISFAMV